MGYSIHSESWHEATFYNLLMSVLGSTCFLTQVNSELAAEQVGSRTKSTVLVLDEIVIVSIETAVRRELE